MRYNNISAQCDFCFAAIKRTKMAAQFIMLQLLSKNKKNFQASIVKSTFKAQSELF